MFQNRSRTFLRQCAQLFLCSDRHAFWNSIENKNDENSIMKSLDDFEILASVTTKTTSKIIWYLGLGYDFGGR